MDSQQLCDVESFIILKEIVVHSYIVLICFFMAIYIMLLRKQSRNRRVIRYCMSARIPKILSHLNVLIHDNDIVCIDKPRMDRNAFNILASLAKNIGGLTDSKKMLSTEKLAMFLNTLAHHEKNKSIKVDYIRSGWSVSRAFNECLRVILKLTPVLLVKPNPVLEDDTDDRWKWFKGCLGALDGTYISIRVEAIYKPRYRTRKGDITTNVLGVCNRNLNFIYVLPGWEGSTADGCVLRDVVVRKYGLTVPQGYRYWLKDWQGNNPSHRCREELFNMKHVRARNVIEREFELLKGRWGILKNPSWYSVKVHNRIISACCLIHNFIGREMEADPLDVEMEFHMENQHEHENINTIEVSDEWTTWRDELAQSMWNERLGNQSL
ncbi:hypothetical protein R3W88_022576 [Solanum pinnatisectum]|uniref:DDE Tnp4 domain-containing protein n=1 Tax=Solanum pinnatisectum TaxID=50273 RepID=A0AAV9LVU0_9SOLN|nr:hypothetical protein R3W88_022576 [Solanum pinnatisectum]